MITEAVIDTRGIQTPLSSPPEVRVRWWKSRAAASVYLAGIGTLIFFASLGHVNLQGMSGVGLISVLPVASLVGVVVISLAFMLALSLPRPNWFVLGGTLVALVVCLDGITAFVETDPRFATAYQIAGFVNYVSSTGHVAPNLDAYFNWPGFFALVSMITGVAGSHGILGLVKYWPMMIDLLYLPALYLLFRNLRVAWRAKGLGLFLFVVGNWVGQDYFSPQAFNYLLYLLFVAILVNWFTDPYRSRPPELFPRSVLVRTHRRLFGILTPGEMPERHLPTGQRAFLVLLLTAIFTVSTVSHQLTPFFMMAVCGGLWLVRRSTLPTLPVLLGVILAGFVSFATVEYWSGHLTDVFGAFGHLGSNLTSSVGKRVTGSSSTHVLVLHAREAVPAFIVILACAGLVRRRRMGFDDRVLMLLIFAPAFMIALQSYGGEMGLRIYLFLLPAACLAGACLIYPDPEASSVSLSFLGGWVNKAGLTALAVVLPIAFFVARYGNEAFEQTPPGELAAADWVYAQDHGGLRLLWLSPAPLVANTPTMPWSFKDIDTLEYIPVLSPLNPANVGGVISDLRQAGPGSYLILTQTLTAALEQTVSYPSDWQPRIAAALEHNPNIEVAYSNASAEVFSYRWPAGSRSRPVALAGGGLGHNTYGWTRAGIILTWLLLAVLLARQLLILWSPGAVMVRRLGFLAAPMLVILAADILFRFAVI